MLLLQLNGGISLPSPNLATVPLVVPKLDRLARSVPDAREIADALQARGVKLALGASLYDPADPMGKMFFNVLATFAEFEGDLIRKRQATAACDSAPGIVSLELSLI